VCLFWLALAVREEFHNTSGKRRPYGSRRIFFGIEENKKRREKREKGWCELVGNENVWLLSFDSPLVSKVSFLSAYDDG
jgi:hypothetical protein